MRDATLYETDIVAWAEQQVAALRRLAETAPSNNVDWDNVIEEVESVGRSQVNGVERWLVLILVHLLKAVSAPEAPAQRGWRVEVVGAQRLARKRFAPSMRQLIDVPELWADARRQAGASLLEWGDDIARDLPAACPFTLAELTADDFDIDTALARLTAALKP